jgi:hypothetical protein
LIKSDPDYQKTFSNDFDLRIYLSCIQILRKANSVLEEFSMAERTNFRFHAAMVATMLLCGKTQPSQEEIISADPATFDEAALNSKLRWLFEQASSYQKANGGSLNTISKSAEFVETLKKNIMI